MATRDNAHGAVFSRRGGLSAAVTAGLSLPLLAACGAADEGTVTSGAGPGDVTTTPGGSPAPTPAAEPTSEAPDTAGGSAPRGLTPTSDIPVGGGVVFTDDRVVVTQPEAGTFKCFSAVCTHEGCLVSSVTTSITCVCHASSFDLATGEVLGGPAPAPLPAVDFTLVQDQVVLS